MRFSIRSALLITLVVALALGWWLDRKPVSARFQMHTVTTPTGSRAYVLDTATGQVWEENMSGFYPPKG